jgi:hypothetical protein
MRGQDRMFECLKGVGGGGKLILARFPVADKEVVRARKTAGRMLTLELDIEGYRGWKKRGPVRREKEKESRRLVTTKGAMESEMRNQKEGQTGTGCGMHIGCCQRRVESRRKTVIPEW